MDLTSAVVVLGVGVLALALVARRRPADPDSGPLRGRRLLAVVVAHLGPLVGLPLAAPLILTVAVRKQLEVRARVARAFDLQLAGVVASCAIVLVMMRSPLWAWEDLWFVDAILTAFGALMLAVMVAMIVSAYRGSRLLATWRPLLTVLFPREPGPEPRAGVPEPTSRPR